MVLNRKNALLAGSDSGDEHWDIFASLIGTTKLNGIDPQTYLADILARIAMGHPINRLSELRARNGPRTADLRGYGTTALRQDQQFHDQHSNRAIQQRKMKIKPTA